MKNDDMRPLLAESPRPAQFVRGQRSPLGQAPPVYLRLVFPYLADS